MRDLEKALLRANIIKNGIDFFLKTGEIDCDKIELASEILQEAKEQLQAEKDKKTLEEVWKEEI